MRLRESYGCETACNELYMTRSDFGSCLKITRSFYENVDIIISCILARIVLTS